MALPNFDKLRPKKKEMLLQSIIDCLKVHDYDELTINDIVEEAEISRGSFYNYFIDKNDAITTLINSKLYALRDIFFNNIKQSNNSLFDGTLKTYEEIENYLANEIFSSIIKNIHYIRDIVTKIFYSERFGKDVEETVDWLINNTNEGKATLTDREKMLNVFGLILSLVLEVLSCKVEMKGVEVFKYSNFKFKLDIIKRGTMSLYNDNVEKVEA